MGAAIREARSDADFAAAAELFRRYQAELGVDLCFQGFERELADLRSAYDVILLAGPENAPTGCVGLRSLGAGRCEMKRLYIEPGQRGSGLGRALADRIVEAARARGYREMTLDTLQRLARAIAIYQSMGFEQIAPYYDNPLDGVVYMRLKLDPAPASSAP